MSGMKQVASAAAPTARGSLLGGGAWRLRRTGDLAAHGVLFAVTCCSALAILFIFAFVIADALPFFRARGFREFFTSVRWYPSGAPAEFGAAAIFAGSALATAGAVLVSAPLGVVGALCLSDVLPFSVRQIVKPVVEILAAIPSVAFGFFALVVLAPVLQEHGPMILAASTWAVGAPLALVGAAVLSDVATAPLKEAWRPTCRFVAAAVLGALALAGLFLLSRRFGALQVLSGVNALNVSIVLGIMALPTVVSVSEDALSAVGRELREGSYALGATRVETLIRVVMPAASGGIAAAVLLGVMRAAGETMVVWMASGNSARIPHPWFNLLEPIRTLTTTIAGDMGEADMVTGSSRYHVLFAMGLCLLSFSFLCNVTSEWAMRRSRAKAG